MMLPESFKFSCPPANLRKRRRGETLKNFRASPKDNLDIQVPIVPDPEPDLSIPAER